MLAWFEDKWNVDRRPVSDPIPRDNRTTQPITALVKVILKIYYFKKRLAMENAYFALII